MHYNHYLLLYLYLLLKYRYVLVQAFQISLNFRYALMDSQILDVLTYEHQLMYHWILRIHIQTQLQIVSLMCFL